MAIVHVIRESVRGCHSVAFDAHAVRMMKQRGVSEDEVLDVLRNPTQTNLRADANRLHFRKQTGPNSHLDVIFEEDPTQIVVITVVRK
jgi:hypothetical protein